MDDILPPKGPRPNQQNNSVDPAPTPGTPSVTPPEDSNSSPSAFGTSSYSQTSKEQPSTSTPSGTTTTDDVAETPEPASSPQPVVSNHSGGKGKKIALVLALVLLVAGAAAAAYYFLYASKPNNAASTQTETKKDIPNARYVSALYGWETYYPESDNTSTYMEANELFFESLVRYENKTQIVPLLAKSWTNPDDSTWVFTLKQGVQFHTGREMKADDVKASLDAVKETVWGETFGNTIASVTVNDPYKVTIKTDAPDPTLLKKLIFLKIYDTKSGKTADPVNGTGPFVVKAGTTPKENSVEAVAFDKYHGGRIHVRSISFIGVEDDEGAKAFETNKGDITDTLPGKLTRAHKSFNVEPNSVFLLLPNTKRANSPLANVKVRQALYLASDPAALGKVRNEEIVPAGQLVPASIPGYNPEIKRPERDVVKAKALLKEAGYANGVSLTFTYFNATQNSAEELKRQLAEAGITLKLDPKADVKELGATLGSGNTDIMSQTYSSDILDASDVLANYADYPFYSNDEVLDLLKSAQGTRDSSKRLATLQDAVKVMSDDLGVIPFYAPKSSPVTYDASYVMQRDINASAFLGVYWTKVYAK